MYCYIRSIHLQISMSPWISFACFLAPGDSPGFGFIFVALEKTFAHNYWKLINIFQVVSEFSWWFETSFLWRLPGKMTQFDEHIFQMDWNHQLQYTPFSPRWNSFTTSPIPYKINTAPLTFRLMESIWSRWLSKVKIEDDDMGLGSTDPETEVEVTWLRDIYIQMEDIMEIFGRLLPW